MEKETTKEMTKTSRFSFLFIIYNLPFPRVIKNSIIYTCCGLAAKFLNSGQVMSASLKSLENVYGKNAFSG